MKNRGLFYCGIITAILGLLGAISAASPTSESQMLGGMFAGIVLAIIGGRKKQRMCKKQ